MNLGEMRLDVRERLGENTPNFWSNEFINRKLNQGQIRFAREERWPWLYAIKSGINVAQGASSIELEEGIDWTRQFALALYKAGSEVPILPKRVTTFTALRIRRSEQHTAGEPVYWFAGEMVKDPAEDEYAHTAVLVPAADQAYTAEYYYIREPEPMTADDSECFIPEAYQEAVVAWATAQCWLKEISIGERKAQSEFNIYNSVLEQAQDDMKSQAQDTVIAWGGDPVGRPSPRDELLRRLFTVPLGA